MLVMLGWHPHAPKGKPHGDHGAPVPATAQHVEPPNVNSLPIK